METEDNGPEVSLGYIANSFNFEDIPFLLGSLCLFWRFLRQCLTVWSSLAGTLLCSLHWLQNPLWRGLSVPDSWVAWTTEHPHYVPVAMHSKLLFLCVKYKTNIGVPFSCIKFLKHYLLRRLEGKRNGVKNTLCIPYSNSCVDWLTVPNNQIQELVNTRKHRSSVNCMCTWRSSWETKRKNTIKARCFYTF